MVSYIRSENLKFKRTFSRKLIFIAPICITLFAYLASAGMPEAQNAFCAMTLNWWALIFAPLGPAVLCILSVLQEKKSSRYISILSRGVSRKKFWMSKVLVANLYLLMSSLALFSFFGVASYLFYGSFLNASNVFFSILVSFIASASLSPINLFMQHKTSTLITVIFNFICIVAGVLLAPKNSWFICPWSFALRLESPILGLHPNGTILAEGSSLWNTAVVPVGICIAIAFFVVTSIVTAIIFDKQEEVS